jgi:hypothetical protein
MTSSRSTVVQYHRETECSGSILWSEAVLGFTQSLTEMSSRNRKIMFLGSRALPVRRADNLTAICEPIV